MSTQTKTPNKVGNVGFGTQVRRSPYFAATQRWGAAGYSVYNHMYIPRDFGSPEDNFWSLINDAILCDVAVERQVEITGPDAARFVQYLTPRDLSKMQVGQAKYILVTDQHGGIINDPILLRLAENHFWISIGDSDVLLWAKGVAVHAGMDVTICEPDVSPLQLQGPRSRDIIRDVFGDAIADLKYYWFVETILDDIPVVVSRTGWSSELGYEIFLRDGSKGDDLWERLMKAGKPHGLVPGHTSSIRRIEGAMQSYHADMDLNTNPYELGLGRLVNLDMNADFIGKQALAEIEKAGITRLQVGIKISGEALAGPNNTFWRITHKGKDVGYVTSAIYSPRLEANIALAMMDIDASADGLAVEINMQELDEKRNGETVPKPFYDPKKQIAAT